MGSGGGVTLGRYFTWDRACRALLESACNLHAFVLASHVGRDVEDLTLLALEVRVVLLHLLGWDGAGWVGVVRFGWCGLEWDWSAMSLGWVWWDRRVEAVNDGCGVVHKEEEVVVVVVLVVLSIQDRIGLDARVSAAAPARVAPSARTSPFAASPRAIRAAARGTLEEIGRAWGGVVG